MRKIITLLTDFGTADGYVGEMKGVLLSGAANVDLVDIAHDIAPQDVEGARLVVARYWRKFPAGTVHLVIVDPGVGSSRRALAVASDGLYLVGPDNGVLSPALLSEGARVAELPISTSAAPTFHGRDVFAPAAARLAAGASLDSLGVTALDPVVARTPPTQRLNDGSIAGVVIAVDRFGNLITNLGEEREGILVVGDVTIGEIVSTYSSATSGGLVAVIGSGGSIEIALRDGNAANHLGAGRGTRVRLYPPLTQHSLLEGLSMSS